jgi:hypothetical protein
LAGDAALGLAADAAVNVVKAVGKGEKAAGLIDDAIDAEKAMGETDNVVKSEEEATEEAAEDAVKAAGKAEKAKRTQAELDDLAKDPARGNKMDIKSIREREVGLELETKGKVGKLIRDTSGKAEFIDTTTGKKWDVKAFNSNFAPKGYNLTDAIKNIKRSIAHDENVMLDTSNLKPSDLAELLEEINKQGLSDKVIY